MLPSPLPLKSSTTNLDLVFAHNTYGETTVPIGLTLEERRRHMYIIGATGTGKTTSLLHMIHHDLLKGSGVGIIDPHGDLIQKLLGVIPEERIKDVVYFNPYDIERPVGLNILELSKGLSDVETQREKDLIASSVISIFQKLYPPRYSGPRMEHILRNTVLTALELEKPTLMTVYRLLTNKEFRKKALTSLPKGILKDFWNDEFGKLGSFQKAEQISPITNKLGRFLTTSLTRNILTQEESKLNFEEIMNTKKILLCDLSKGRIGEDTSSFLGSLLVAKLQLAALKRVDIPQDKRTDYFLYIDEFQNFATPSFAQILSEARKYRLNTILAHQTISQIEDKNLFKVILANVGSIISFRTSNPSDEDILLPLFAPQVEKNEISNLPSYHFYMKINAIEPQNAFTGAIDDFTIEENESIRESVIKDSRESYGIVAEKVHKSDKNNKEQKLSLSTTPFSGTYTSVFAVPKSIPSFLLKNPIVVISF
jgi:DNA helicase HerA-like ATPase